MSLLTTFFDGSKVRLSPLTSADVPTLTRWQADTEYLRMLAAEPAFPKNEQQVAEWVRDGQRGRDNYLLGIRAMPEWNSWADLHTKVGGVVES